MPMRSGKRPVVGFLYRLGAAYGLNSADELDQEAVAHGLEEPPGVLGDLGLDDPPHACFESASVPASSLPMSFE